MSNRCRQLRSYLLIFGRVRLFPSSTALRSFLREHVGRTANASSTSVQDATLPFLGANPRKLASQRDRPGTTPGDYC